MTRKKKNFPLLLFIFIPLIIFLTLFNVRIIRERDGNLERIEALEEELERIKAGREDLESSLDWEAREEYLERVLREDFLMIKPGEHRVIILDEREEKEEEEEEERSFFHFLPWVD